MVIKKASYLEDHNFTHCCGCNACVQICPVSCIKMEPINGFYYPKIDEEKCIHCGLCRKVCQYSDGKSNVKEKQEILDVYAGWNAEEKDVVKSTSGGIFPVLAKYVLENNGVVFGTILDENQEAKVVVAESLEEIEAMRGSKYTRSDTQETYKLAKKYLETGSVVLYAGTPCQIAGLRAFLRKPYEQLICVDLICHGVPSELLIKHYKKYLEEKYNSSIVDFQFRHTTEGNMESEYYIEFQNGQVLKEGLGVNKYSKTYNSLIAHMPSCTSCVYTTTKRSGDITIGDFWGINKINPEHVNAHGTSLIAVNTKKGQEIMEKVQNDLKIYPHKIEEALPYNPPLSHSNKPHPWRKGFLRMLEKEGFEKSYKKYIVIGNKILIIYRVFRKIKTIITERIKHVEN